MAIEQTVFTPEAQVFGFNTAGGAELDRTNLPRGEVVFTVVNGTVAVPTLGDSQLVRVACECPGNFTYVLVDMFPSIEGVDGDDWDDAGLGKYGAFPNPQSWFELTTVGAVTQTTAGRKARSYSAPRLPRNVSLGGGAGAPQCLVQIANDNINGSTMNLQFYARFLMYDIEQFHNVAVNSPLLVR